MITRTQAIHLFGSVKLLQQALGLKTHSAIYMWSKDKPIPETHELRIRYELRPDAFDAAGNLIAARRPRKNVAADSSSVHGDTASRKRRTLKSPRVEGTEASRG